MFCEILNQINLKFKQILKIICLKPYQNFFPKGQKTEGRKFEKNKNFAVFTKIKGNRVILNTTKMSDPFLIGNYFLIETYPTLVNISEGYNLKLYMNEGLSVQLALVIINVGNSENDNRITFHEPLLEVGPYRKCQLMRTFARIAPEESKYFAKTVSYYNWFTCEPNNIKDFSQELTHKTRIISYDFEANESFFLSSAELYFVEPFIRTGNQEKLICGLPEIPIGVMIEKVDDYFKYEQKCSPKFKSIGGENGTISEIFCSVGMKWNGRNIQCYPEIFCNKLDVNKESLSKVHIYKNVYYVNDIDWFAIEGTTALIECKDETNGFFNKSIICDNRGQWSGNCLNGK
jgi:hypothetical protein